MPPEGTVEQSLAKRANALLASLRDYRDEIMALPNDGDGRQHSHGEKDNTKGLRARAISVAITNLESSMKYLEDAFNPSLTEYLMKE